MGCDMPIYYWVVQEYEEDGQEYEKTISFCQYITDAEIIQKEHEGSIIKMVKQKNTWEWIQE